MPTRSLRCTCHQSCERGSRLQLQLRVVQGQGPCSWAQLVCEGPCRCDAGVSCTHSCLRNVRAIVHAYLDAETAVDNVCWAQTVYRFSQADIRRGQYICISLFNQTHDKTACFFSTYGSPSPQGSHIAPVVSMSADCPTSRISGTTTFASTSIHLAAQGPAFSVDATALTSLPHAAHFRESASQVSKQQKVIAYNL